MYISYEYYRIFYHVARCGNLTKAAEALQNSQPNLTRAIRNLEAEIGCPLFSRTNRGMILTPEGEGLYRHIKIACTEIEAGEAAVTQSRTLERGNVFLAASEGALRCLLLPVLKRYQEKYPGVHLRISNHSTPQAIDALKNGFADIFGGARVVPMEKPQPCGIPENPRMKGAAEVMAVSRVLYENVVRELAGGYFPIVIGGDHSAAIGAVSGSAFAWRSIPRSLHISLYKDKI